MKKYLVATILSAILITVPEIACADLATYDFRDDDGNPIAYGNDALTLDNNNRCAYSGPSANPTHIYCCTASSTPSPIYSKVPRTTVLPNGAFFQNSINETIYICSTDGQWHTCSDKTSAILRRACNGEKGYRHFFVSNEISGTSITPSDFCNNTYDYMTRSYHGGGGSLSIGTYCDYKSSNNQDVYQYTSCRAGYYIKKDSVYGTSCERCGSVSNGAYNPTDDHTNKSCVLSCDPGYGASNGECLSGVLPGYDCPTGQFNISYYGGDNNCLSCPSGAKCDGNEMYCPAGSYIYTNYDGQVPKCTQCPDNGMVQADFADDLNPCDDDVYAWGKGVTAPVCKWTNYATNNADNCISFRGSDITGSYEYKNPDNTWYECTYNN